MKKNIRFYFCILCALLINFQVTAQNLKRAYHCFEPETNLDIGYSVYIFKDDSEVINIKYFSYIYDVGLLDSFLVFNEEVKFENKNNMNNFLSENFQLMIKISDNKSERYFDAKLAFILNGAHQTATLVCSH